MRPSFLAAGISGLLILLVIIILIQLFNKSELNLYSQSTLQTLLLLSIALGVHGLQHANEEVNYDFNPLVGKWEVRDDKV